MAAAAASPSLAAQPASDSYEQHALQYGVHLAEARSAARALGVAEQLIEQQRYAESLPVLVEIRQAAGDSFLPPQADDPSGRPSSLKAAAARMIGDLPQAGRKAYLLEVQANSQRAWAAAMSQGDSALADVASRFVYTDAGHAALWALAQRALDRGQYDLTIRNCRVLLEDPALGHGEVAGVRAQLLLALLLDGREEQARQLASQQPLAREAVGKLLAVPDDADPDGWVGGVVARLAEAEAGRAGHAGQWLLDGGSTRHNPVAPYDPPHLWARWAAALPASDVPPANPPGFELTDAGPAPCCPLVVGDHVVARRGDLVVGVHRETGKLVWQAHLAPTESAAGQQRLAARREGRAAERAMCERLLDGVTSSLASNGHLVFAVTGDTPPRAAERSLWDNGRRRYGGRRAGGNQLVAIDTATQGKLKWRYLAEDAENGGRYLGCPLPVGEQLYSVLEVEQTLYLEERDQQTGRQQWKQPLATVETPINEQPLRRLIGAQLAYADGLLVCSTGVGLVIAISPADRSLEWVYHFPVAQGEADGQDAFFAGQRVQELPELEQCAWLRNQLTIAGEHVIVCSPESRRVHALHLGTGEPAWSRSVGRDRLLGAVADDAVLVLGRQAVTALNAGDGSQRWSKHLPRGARPSAVGVCFDDAYLLPMSDGTAIALAVESGQQLNRYRVGPTGQLGCLAMDANAVYSQSLAGLSRFDLRADDAPHDAAVVAAERAYVRGDSAGAFDRLATVYLSDRSKPAALALQALLPEQSLAGPTNAKRRRVADALYHDRTAPVALTLAEIAASADAGARGQLVAALAGYVGRPPAGALQVLHPHTAVHPNRFLRAVLSRRLDDDQRIKLRTRLLSAGDGLVTRSIVDQILPETGPTTAEDETPPQVDTGWSIRQATASVSKREARVRRTARARPSSELREFDLPLTCERAATRGGLAHRLVATSDGRLLGLDAYGDYAFGVELSRASPTQLRRRAARSTTVAACVGGVYYADTGEDVVAIDAQSPHAALWSAQERMLGARFARDGRPSQQFRAAMHSSVREQLRLVGAGRGGVVIAADDMVACLDPGDGEVQWVVRDVETRGVLTTDGRSVYASPNTNPGWRLDLMDGRRTTTTPPSGEVVAASGAMVALHVERPGGASLSFYDRTEGRVVQERPIEGELHAEMLSGLLTAIDSQGGLHVVDLEAGRVLVEGRLQPSQPIESLSCTRLGDRLCVAVNYAPRHVQRAAGVTPVDRNQVITGMVMAYNLQTGEPLWQSPAFVDRLALLARQPAASPILALAARVRMQDASGRYDTMRVLLLDAATGRSVYRNASLRHQRGSDYRISVQQGAWPQYTLALDSKKIVLDLTEQPLPPTPPATAEVEEARQTNLWTAGSELGRLLEEGLQGPSDREAGERSQEP